MANNKNALNVSVDNPGSWLIQAINLKEAAEKLDWTKLPLNKHLNSNPFTNEYKLLMGFSLENLLKVTIILNRINKNLEAIETGDWILNTHDFKKLAERVIESDIISLSNKDLSILD